MIASGVVAHEDEGLVDRDAANSGEDALGLLDGHCGVDESEQVGLLFASRARVSPRPGA